MSLGLYLRMMLRESRGARGRMAFFVACLAVGVAAVVAVAALSAGLDQALRREARQLLAADLRVQGQQPLPAQLDAFLAARPQIARTDLKELVTVVAAEAGSGGPGRSQLVELKAVAGDYPFYGTLELAPDQPLAQLLDAGSTVVAAEVLQRLQLAVGDTLRIGGEPFRIAGVVLSEPDRVTFSLTLGPRIFISLDGLARTQLEGYGSRIGYRALLRLPPEVTTAQLDDTAGKLRELLAELGTFQVETYAEAQPALRRGLARMERYLGLVALLSLLIGGIGVAQTVRAWLAGRLDAIAVLKCLGLRPREVVALYLGQAAVLGLAGSLLGALLGTAVPQLVPYLLGGLIAPGAIATFSGGAVLRGVTLGVGVAVLFSLPPLAAVRRVPPVRVLRRDAEPLPANRSAWLLLGVLLTAGVAAMATLQSGSLSLGLGFTAGLAAATAVLSLAAALVRRLAAALPRDFGRLWLRHGLAALGRPGAGTGGAIVALGLGVLVVLAMSLVERQLSAQLDAELPADAPSAFLVDIQPAQWPGVAAELARAGGEEVRSVPVVTARLAGIDGRTVEQVVTELPAEQRSRRRWALTREQRLTYLETLPDDNEVVAGRLWSDPERAELSLERDFAENLGVGLGSVLRFDVQGVELDLTVTSLRTVRWESFGLNFFLVAEPGVLDAAPQFRIATVLLPPEREQELQDHLAGAFPNVTLLRIREILGKVLQVLERLGLGVRFLGGFTVIAGLAILGGAVSAGAARRGREVALLKALGVTRGGVVAMFSAEYALVGLVAGTIGAAGGGVLAWAVLTRGMEIVWSFHPLPYLLAIAGTAALTVLAGLAASLRALERRPVEVLRQAE